MSRVSGSLYSNMDIKRVRRWLFVFFLAIAIPAALLIAQTYSQLKWESFHQQRGLAEELSQRIETRFSQLINAEEARPFTDYAFLNLAGDPDANFLQLSPIARYPVATEIPGLIGYFQLDAKGELSTPIVPIDISRFSSYGIDSDEQNARLELQTQIYQILSQNHLLDNTPRPAEAAAPDSSSPDRQNTTARLAAEKEELVQRKPNFAKRSESVDKSNLYTQIAFDQLERKVPNKDKQDAFTRIDADDLELADNELDGRESRRKQQFDAGLSKKKARIEFNSLPILAEEISATKEDTPQAESLASVPTSAAASAIGGDSQYYPGLKVRTFESAIDPLVFSQLESGHFVLFRKVWRDGERTIQGLLIEQQSFLQALINTLFQQTGLSLASNLLVSYRGDNIEAYPGRSGDRYLGVSRDSAQFNGQALYRSRLNEPFAELELQFNINKLPPGPGAQVVVWLSIILMLILLVGFYLMYRLAARQIELARQQQDFVSAVSHELKTPLTSIRMYGEMLKQGWAAEDKKPEYYNFIFDESERLSRLINNVLQLARMSRNEQQANVRQITVMELVSLLESKVSSQITRAGFQFKLECKADGTMSIDVDWFTQIILNLVDNALKFSADADNKTIDISCQRLADNVIQFSIRDYGPGIEKQQMKSIFKLFYRSENETTRDTIGTGIGLALVQQMTQAMAGSIDVVNQQPGVEFRLTFPVDDSES
ncbi:MAG: HAMP domain-containing histidine kinase [Xanthomonadales bacterium]|nr:HAMP domain-containing histidine kinase [Xanthomonadales bacterium]